MGGLFPTAFQCAVLLSNHLAPEIEYEVRVKTFALV
jgi:Na+-translocating ferredoxin:NAD+ oxidoreductase RnfD subunit